MKKTILILCLVIFTVSVCGCPAGTHSEDTVDKSYDDADYNSQVTNTTSSSSVNENEDSDPMMEEQMVVCPHCNGDPNHLCQLCPDGCYLCGGTGYVYK